MTHKLLSEKHSGSVVECSTPDRGFTGSSLAGDAVLNNGKTQARKLPDMDEKLLSGM